MRYWSSGEIESSIGDSFRKSMNILEEKINSLTNSKNYSNDVDSLDVIYIIVKDGGMQKYKYNSKTKELDLRVVIDYHNFLSATNSEQNFILINGLINAIGSALIKKKISYFNISEFREDLNKIFSSYEQ